MVEMVHGELQNYVHDPKVVLAQETLFGSRLDARYCSWERITASRRMASRCASLILLNILSLLPDCDFP